MLKRNVINSVFGLLLMSLSLSYTSCTNPCDTVVCKNSGICSEGSCTCQDGYEGPYCEFKVNEKFTGTWDGTYRCNAQSNLIKTLIVSPGETPNKIYIYDLFNQGENIPAIVSGYNLNLIETTIGSDTYSGNGYVEGSELTIFYKHKDGLGNEAECLFRGSIFEEN